MGSNEEKNSRFIEIINSHENKWDEAKPLIEDILKEGIEKNDIYLIAAAYYWLGVVCFRAGDKSKMLSYSLKANAFVSGIDDYELKSRSYNLLAVVYTLSEQYLLANDSFQKAYDILIDHPCDGFKITSIFNNFSVNYFRMGNIEKAIEYSERCREVLNPEDPEYSRLLFMIGENLSWYYETCGEYEKALENTKLMKQAMDIGKNFPEDQSCYYVRLCAIMFLKNDTEKGIEYADKAICIGDVGVGEHEPQTDYEVIAKSLINMKEWDRAKVYIDFLHDYAWKSNIASDKIIYYRTKAYFSEARGDEKDLLKCLRNLNECYETQKDESLATERMIQKQFDDSMKEIKELTQQVKEKEKSALTDSLTGLLNKSGAEKIAGGFCESGRGTLLILDLDSFKLINDIYGHQSGDIVLKEFADIIKNRCISEDIICRVGGDEFIACIQNNLEEKVIGSFTDYLNSHINYVCKKLFGDEFNIPIGVSVGAVQVPESGEKYDVLFDMADKAMYQVKQNGKHGYSLYHVDKHKAEDGVKDLEKEMNRMLALLKERGIPVGAMSVGQDDFISIYRYMERFSERDEIDISIFMLTINRKDGIDDDFFSDAFYQFEKYLHTHLRIYDLILGSQNNTIFVMMPDVPGENPKTLVERILKEWEINCDAHKALDIKIV